MMIVVHIGKDWTSNSQPKTKCHVHLVFIVTMFKVS